MIPGSGAFCTFCLLALVSSADTAIGARPLACDPVLTGLFTPRHPEIGQFEICTSPGVGLGGDATVCHVPGNTLEYYGTPHSFHAFVR